jgi:hypothetical protein
VLELVTNPNFPDGAVPNEVSLVLNTTREVDLSFELNFLSGDSDLQFLIYAYPDDGGDWASVVVTNSSNGSTRVLARLDTRIATGNYTNVLGSTGWLPYSVRLPFSSGPRSVTFSATAFVDDIDPSRLQVRRVRACVVPLTPSATGTASGTGSQAATPSSSATGSRSGTGSQTGTQSSTLTGTGSASATGTGTGSSSATGTGSASATGTASVTPTSSHTATRTPSATCSPFGTLAYSFEAGPAGGLAPLVASSTALVSVVDRVLHLLPSGRTVTLTPVGSTYMVELTAGAAGAATTLSLALEAPAEIEVTWDCQFEIGRAHV